LGAPNLWKRQKYILLTVCVSVEEKEGGMRFIYMETVGVVHIKPSVYISTPCEYLFAEVKKSS